MKRLVDYLIFYIVGVLLFLCFIKPFEAYSQFLNKNATWTMRDVLFAEDPIENYEVTQILKDSVINGINYSLFEFRQTFSAIREDSNKVFYKVLKHNFPNAGFDTLEHVLYDFRLNEGDSILLELPSYSKYYKNKWVVREVDSILVVNKLKKRILLEIPDSYGPGNVQYWIEDIGSTFGPLYFTGISEHEWEIELFCYRLNNEKLYGKCKTVGLNNLRSENEISVHFNSISKQIKIGSPTKENCTLTIYSLAGIKILKTIISSNEYTNLNNLSKGLFIFEVETNNGRKCEKIYIQ